MYNVEANIYNDQIEIIKDKTVQMFLDNFEKALAQKSLIDFDKIFDQTLLNLNLIEYKDEIKDQLSPYLHMVFDYIHKQKFLEEYIEDKSNFEILVHSHQYIQLDKGDNLSPISLENLSERILQLSLESMALQEKKEWNYKTPFSSFNIILFGHSFRATLIHHSITPEKSSKVFLRRISKVSLTLDKFDINLETINFLNHAITEKKNILIAGSTGSGKTTFTKSLISLIPSSEHLVVLEDTFELDSFHASQSNLLAKDKMEGKSLKDFCSYAMRMRPDRMVIGEMRSHEVVPFVLAMNTGHKGLMSTIHANSAADAIGRISLLFSLYSETKDLSYELVMKLVSQNVDYIVFLENKSVKEIISVLGSENGNPFYESVFNKVYENGIRHER